MLVTSKSDPASKVISWWWQTCVLFCIFLNLVLPFLLCFLYFFCIFKNIFWWKMIVIRPLKCISWWWRTCVLSFTSVSNFPAFGRHQAKLLLEKIFDSSDTKSHLIRNLIWYKIWSDTKSYLIQVSYHFQVNRGQLPHAATWQGLKPLKKRRRRSGRAWKRRRGCSNRDIKMIQR